MDRRDGPVFLVREKNGKAIGGPDDEKEPGHVRDQDVAAQAGPRQRFHPVDDVGVDLAHDDKPELFEALGPAEILLPPGAGPESMDEPGDLLQARSSEVRTPFFRHELMYYQKSRPKKSGPAAGPPCPSQNGVIS
jgi:hypothetical protein